MHYIKPSLRKAITALAYILPLLLVILLICSYRAEIRQLRAVIDATHDTVRSVLTLYEALAGRMDDLQEQWERDRGGEATDDITAFTPAAIPLPPDLQRYTWEL